MGQLCLNGTWNNGVLTWTRSEPLEGNSTEAERLLALYEQGNMVAQGGDLPKALAIFQRGLSGFIAIDNPDAHHRMAEAALLWGLGTAADRVERGEEGWRTLMQILAPGKKREQLPLGLAINWTHSATLAGFRHDKYNEVAALLEGFQNLGWGEDLGSSPEARGAVRDSYAMLAPYRARCFEGLMQEQRFEEAAELAQRAIASGQKCQPDDTRNLHFWENLLALAQQRKANFRLENLLPEDAEHEPVTSEESNADLPALKVRWDGQGALGWQVGETPEDANNSALARIYAEAAEAAAQGDLQQALALYDKGLASWDSLKHPRTCDALVRAMMLLGKATVQDQLDSAGPAEAWITLMRMTERQVGTALPLPLVLSWAQRATIVGCALGRHADVQTLLAFLVQMSLHPKLGQANPALGQELMNRFLFLLEGAYGGLEDQPAQAADWAISLQRKVEPQGMVLMPLRELLFHALSAAHRHREAEVVAKEVLSWARQQSDAETTQEWMARAAAAKNASLS